MPNQNFMFTSLHSGEIGSDLRARTDLPYFNTGFLQVENFIPYSLGGLLYRPGWKFVGHTKYHETAVMGRYMYDYGLTYALCFTPNFCRLCDNGGILLQEDFTVTDVNTAGPAVIVTTSAAHNLLNGDEIFLSELTDMIDINRRFFTVNVTGATTFELYDIKFTNPVSSSSTYSSGGRVALVYDIVTPYEETDLPNIRMAQKGTVAYMVDGRNEPQKFALNESTGLYEILPYDRTSDPFTEEISNITQANPAVVTTTNNHEYFDDEKVYIRGVSGMNEVNGQWFSVKVLGATTFSLHDPDTGANINSTGYGAYTSGGTSANENNQPSAIGFYGGRFYLGATNNQPDAWWASRGPTDKGKTRYEDFTTGTDDTHALYQVISSQNNTIERIHFFAGTPKFLAIGAVGGVYKATGAGGDSTAITANSIYVVPVDYYGAAQAAPAFFSSETFYIPRGGVGLMRFGYDIYKDSYASLDLALQNPDVVAEGIKTVSYQRWKSDILWAVGNDGQLKGLSSKSNENQAWFNMSAKDTKFLAVVSEVTFDTPADNLWCVTEREIDGETVRYIEFMGVDQVIPRRNSFFTGDEAEDERAWDYRRAWLQQDIARLDARLDNHQDVTPAATLTVDGTDVSTDADVFSSDDVGRQISVTFDTGYEKGLCEITSVTDARNVEVVINEDFSELPVAVNLEAGKWMLSTDRVDNLWHLEGEEVSITADGGQLPNQVVTDGTVSFDQQFFRIAVGKSIRGVLQTVPLTVPIDQVGNQSFGRTLSVGEVSVAFKNSYGFSIGDSLYDTVDATGFEPINTSGLPPLMQTGEVREASFSGYDFSKSIYLTKEDTLPLDILALNCDILVGEA